MADRARPVDAGAVAANIANVRARIAAAGGEGRTRLVAVTKGFGVDAMRAAAVGGADAIGESYAQELRAKLDALGEAPRLPVHFIGQLQRNKVRELAEVVTLWHSVDRAELGLEIARRRPGAAVLVQVRLTEPQDSPQTASRGGCDPAAIEGLVRELTAAGLSVRGLMGVAPPGDPETARGGFTMLAERAAALGLVELSMGMSGDLEVAVECGSTLVRVGHALFGERAPR